MNRAVCLIFCTERIQYQMSNVRKDSLRRLRRTARVKAMKKSLTRDWLLYLFLLPVVAYVVIFCYWPMYGLQISFQRFTFAQGFSGSEWVGLYWIKKFINSPKFWMILKLDMRVQMVRKEIWTSILQLAIRKFLIFLQKIGSRFQI